MAKVTEVALVERPPSKAWMVGLIAWLVPGAGHAMQGRWIRAAILGGAVYTAFISGLAMGGHLFILKSDGQSSPLYQLPPMIANLGAGLLYFICWFLDTGFADDAVNAARATYEYGNTFLLIAGLLNYLAMLDAFDIAAGRKQ